MNDSITIEELVKSKIINRTNQELDKGVYWVRLYDKMVGFDVTQDRILASVAGAIYGAYYLIMLDGRAPLLTGYIIKTDGVFQLDLKQYAGVEFVERITPNECR